MKPFTLQLRHTYDGAWIDEASFYTREEAIKHWENEPHYYGTAWRLCEYTKLN